MAYVDVRANLGLSLVEWQNLLSDLKTIVNRHGFAAIKEAVEYLDLIEYREAK